MSKGEPNMSVPKFSHCPENGNDRADCGASELPGLTIACALSIAARSDRGTIVLRLSHKFGEDPMEKQYE